MKTLLSTIIISSVISITLSGCTHAHKNTKTPETTKLHKTTKILKQDQARVAITLNKDLTTTVIATNDGQRIKPECVIYDEERQSDSSIPVCDKQNLAARSASEEILYEQTYKISVIKGSVCVTIIAPPYNYKLCDPPYDLSGL
jgi:hypothetical protein